MAGDEVRLLHLLFDSLTLVTHTSSFELNFHHIEITFLYWTGTEVILKLVKWSQVFFFYQILYLQTPFLKMQYTFPQNINWLAEKYTISDLSKFWTKYRLPHARFHLRSKVLLLYRIIQVGFNWKTYLRICISHVWMKFFCNLKMKHNRFYLKQTDFVRNP